MVCPIAVAAALSVGIKGVMDLGEAIRLRRTELGMSQADLAKAADVGARQIRRYEAGEQQPLFTVAVAIASALGIPLAELAGLPAEHAAGPARVLPRVRHGIEFIQRGDSSGELRITGTATRRCCCGARRGLTSTASGLSTR